MTPTQIEAWVISIADRVSRGSRVEDQRVELKSEFPDPPKAARLIAGHANASGGEPVLWIVGLDEKKGATGAPTEQMANWLSAVKAGFDGLSPSFDHLAIPYGGVELVALLADTTRAPFVVRNPDFGRSPTSVALEVPWREGTKTRSATREDLLRILNPLAPAPEFEWRRARIEMQSGPNPPVRFGIQAWIYIVPRGDGEVVLPFHRCGGYVELVGHSKIAEITSLTMSPKYAKGVEGRTLSHTVVASDTEAIVSGPGEIHVLAQATLDQLMPDSVLALTLVMDWTPAFADLPTRLAHEVPISPVGATSSDHWEYIAPAVRGSA